MKKLKSILCMALILLSGCLVLTGCGAPEKPKITTITLNEAKTTILKALKTSNNADNRDLFEKLGKFTLKQEANSSEVDGDYVQTSTYDATCEYKSAAPVKYYSVVEASSIVDNEEELWGREEFFEDGVLYYYDEKDVEETEEYFDSVFAPMSAYYINFSDNAFNNYYSAEVEKQSTKKGYSLTLKYDQDGIVNFINSSKGDDETYWDHFTTTMKTSMYFKVIINFDNSNNIIGAFVDDGIYDYEDYENRILKKESKITVTKYTDTITEPQWLTTYKSAQN